MGSVCSKLLINILDLWEGSSRRSRSSQSNQLLNSGVSRASTTHLLKLEVTEPSRSLSRPVADEYRGAVFPMAFLFFASYFLVGGKFYTLFLGGKLEARLEQMPKETEKTD